MTTPHIRVAQAVIRLLTGDIVRVPADAIVNAANSELIGGGGVDGAIHRAGGPSIMEELSRLRTPRGCPPGAAVVTGAGRLPARHVIHAVGPIWRGGGFGEEELLRDAYTSSLRLAAEKGACTVSFPSISTGAYGYPVAEAAAAALGAVAAFLAHNKTSIREVVFVLFDAAAALAYEEALAKLSHTGGSPRKPGV